MKWSMDIRQKRNITLLLSGMMILILLGTFTFRTSMETVRGSFGSIYKDRLVPAVLIVDLSENFFSKRLLLETYLLTDSKLTLEEVQTRLDRYDRQIESLSEEFARTKLTAPEIEQWQAFRANIEEYARLEAEIMRVDKAGNRAAAGALFSKEGSAAFGRGINLLHDLARLQSDVGEELLEGTRKESAFFYVITASQIVLVLAAWLLMLNQIHRSGNQQSERKSMPMSR